MFTFRIFPKILSIGFCSFLTSQVVCVVFMHKICSTYIIILVFMVNLSWPVLEHGQVVFYSFNYSCSFWRWFTGLCDIRLHSLLPAPWSARKWCTKKSQGKSSTASICLSFFNYQSYNLLESLLIINSKWLQSAS